MGELAPYAARPESSRGRIHEEPEPRYRTPYQRDRDRVVHCSAFRRLEYKTQVFVNHEGDMFRTRLTHSLEVSQIGRTVARALNLNEDLTEAICLAHDLGHTPFGHAGQDALNECMREFGGFEHNLQSLRVVDFLEEKYAEFSGLNLTFETREGILKHCSKTQARSLGEVGRRFLDGTKPGLEAQVANIADEIAYNNHDVDDGLRADLLNIKELSECSLFGEQARTVSARWPDLAPRRAIYEVIRRMIDLLVTDLVNHSGALLAEHAPASADEVRQGECALVSLSADVQARHLELKRYLNRNLYRHYRVQRMSFKAEKIIKALFAVFTDNPRLLPPDMQNKLADSSGEQRARVIADYIAGMTDRYAIAEYERVTDPRKIT